jgi:hypothetical protein
MEVPGFMAMAIHARSVLSFRDPRFAFLVGQSVSWVGSWVGSWAASIVLWGFAAYHFGASPEAVAEGGWTEGRPEVRAGAGPPAAGGDQ